MNTTTIYRDIFRPTPHPSPDLPFGARSAGHYRFLAPFKERPAPKACVHIMWCVAGSGTVIIEKRERTLKAGHIAVYYPGMPRNWFTHGKPWEMRWFTLDGSLAAPLMAAFGLQASVYEVGPAPIALFRQLEQAVREPSRRGELRASRLAFHILTLAAERYQEKPDQQVAGAVDLIHKCWAVPNFNVKTLAAELQAHRSSLTRRFEHVMGVAPKEYLMRLRTQQILSLLQHTDKTIGEIAACCGYTDPNHLSRLVHHITGMSPKQFRARNRPA